MSAPSNFWTLPLEVEFHQTIASLRHLTEIPSEPRAYHGHATLGSHAHTLSIEDEIRTADSFAFLAHHEEGDKFVSTVTLREHSEGLQVVLTSNTAPSPSVLGELTEITNRLSKLSREGLFSKVSHNWVLMCLQAVQSRRQLKSYSTSCYALVAPAFLAACARHG